MDIVNCPACGHGFSPSERVCPRCHNRLPAPNVPWFTIVLVVIVLAALIYFVITA